MIEPSSAYKTVPYDDDILYAVRALRDGTANDIQQKIAFQWIVRDVARHYDQSFHFGGEDGRRASDFMEGRRFVGLQVLKLLESGATPKTRKEKKP